MWLPHDCTSPSREALKMLNSKTWIIFVYGIKKISSLMVGEKRRTLCLVNLSAFC